MTRISFDNVSFAYAGKQPTEVLKDFSFAVGEGESVAIVGPSGCGKTTLLQLACGLIAPTQGRVTVNGEPLERPRQKTGYMLQSFGLMPWKTVLANVEFGLKTRGVPAAERTRRAKQMIEQVGLTSFLSAYPQELSGGMQQRVALARSLVLDLDLLLMDEPLSALDAYLREEMQRLLLRTQQDFGYSQLIVTHSIEEALLFGQRVLVLTSRPTQILETFDNPLALQENFREDPAFGALYARLHKALFEQAGEQHGR